MHKRKIFVFMGILAFLSVVPADATVHAATENDLREVMGLGRLDTDKKAKVLALQTIRECTRGKQHNELLDMLGEYDLEVYTEQIELAEKGETAYQSIMEAFQSAKPAKDVTRQLAAYETYHNNWEAAPSQISYELQKIDEKDITEKMKYAEALLATIESTQDIGTVGIDAVTPTKEERLIVSGLEDDSMSFQTCKGQKLYAILKGTVDSVGVNYVTLACGSTVRLTYYGIRPSVEAEQHVRQGRKLGTAINETVKISMMVTGKGENPVLMYGKKGVSWYQGFQESNAMDYDERISLETDDVKDYPEGQGISSAASSGRNGEEDPGEERSPFDNQNEDVLLEADPFIQMETAPDVRDR